MAATVCAGFLRVEDFDWAIPFRHTILPSFNSSEYLIQAISMGITFPFSGLFFVPLVNSLVWDYSATVTFLHVIVCNIENTS
ncbi:putative transmembrane protein 244 [Gastrophryne carolinensis]